MAIDISSFVLIPGIIIGILAGIVDLIFMIKDETGAASQVIGHSFGAFIPLIIASIISTNLSVLYESDWAQGTLLGNEITMRIAFILVLGIYIIMKSRLFKGARGTGMHESFIHSILVAAIVGLGPYYWPLLAPLLPSFLSGGSSK